MKRIILLSLALLTLSFLLFWNKGLAGIPTPVAWTVFNEVQMYLNKSITSTQTTGIELAAPKLNGDTYSYNTLSGGMLRVSAGSRREDIWYSSGSVNATTKVITLYGVIRGVCENDSDDIVTCNDGKSFSRGSIVELNNDARLYNWKLNINTVNVMDGSGSLRGNTGQPHIFFRKVTKTQRDAFSYKGESSDAYIVPNTTKGVFQYTMDNGTTYIDFGSGSIINANYVTAGKVEIGTGAELLNRTLSGSTNARLVISTQSLTMTGGATYSDGYIPLLNSSGFLDVRAGGTGTGSNWGSGNLLKTQGTGAFVEITTLNVSEGATGLSTITTGAIMVGQGTNAVATIAAGASGYVITSDSHGWAGKEATMLTKMSMSESTGNVGADSTTEDTLGKTFTIPANTMAPGDQYEIIGSGLCNRASQSASLRMKLGSSVVASGAITANMGYSVFNGLITVRTTGVSGAVSSFYTLLGDTDDSEVIAIDETETIDTTSDQILSLTIQNSVSNSSNWCKLYSLNIRKISGP